MHYVELHAKSAFSFLRGASNPEDIFREAARLELPALALLERNGVYSAVRAHGAAAETGVRAIIGAELTMDDGAVVPLLAATAAGYRGLCRLLTAAKLRCGKGECAATWTELAAHAEGLIALTGDEDGPVRRAWRRGDPAAAEQAALRLANLFPGRAYLEIQRHRVRDEDIEENALLAIATRAGLPVVATNGVLYAQRDFRRVTDAFTCLRHQRTFDNAGRLLEINSERNVKSPAMMAALFSDLPEALENTVHIAGQITFSLSELGYRFPDYPVPPGETMDSHLRALTFFGANQRYGSVVGRTRAQLTRELDLIGKLGFAGYFLAVWEICSHCRNEGILVQGRGSAANSAVCYALGITAVDPIAQGLLFERFLSEGRKGWPDIDLDLPSRTRREAVIQHVYARYRGRAAMTANVITYRARNTFREMGKVLGFPDDALDRYTSLFAGGDYPHTLRIREQLKLAGLGVHPRLTQLVDLVQRTHSLPRHLGQHSGGMVLCAGRLDEIVPLENASMPGRTVIEWDKTDCEDMGIVKVDLLGLGMVAGIEESLQLCEARGAPVDLARIPKDDPATYDMLCKADTIGVFQVESRAQMATLPRFRPRCFYDLAMQVAIIRPGPIQGEAVHPLIDRRAGREPVTYWDPRLEPILSRTYGVVLFQEQLLRIAMELGGFSAAEADELRRSIDFKRDNSRMQRMEGKLRAALLSTSTAPEAVERILHALTSFALYSFPESHALSFALIAYASAYLKRHRPAEFFVGLLNAQPMGFYSTATLIQDARRHGVIVRPACIMNSGDGSTIDSDGAIRIGLRAIRGLHGASIADILLARRERPFSCIADLVRRTRLSRREQNLLSSAGALNRLAGTRRQALWEVARADLEFDLFANAAPAGDASAGLLTPMTLIERIAADFATVGLTVGEHPMRYLREQFPQLWRTDELPGARQGARVRIGGSVICRQRPGTAKGFVFLSLEDETGVANAIIPPALFEAERLTITQYPALIVDGVVQHQDGVIHVRAEHILPLRDDRLPAQASHDFH